MYILNMILPFITIYYHLLIAFYYLYISILAHVNMAQGGSSICCEVASSRRDEFAPLWAVCF